MWDPKFAELADFNADKDKSKYTAEYIENMAVLQGVYDVWYLEQVKKHTRWVEGSR